MCVEDQRHAQWQWCGQVLRVAGVDDVDALEEEALPSGHCSVFWLGHNLEQWPSALTKETSVRAVDRPWVLADRVARAVDPRSLGTVVGVHCKLKIAGVPGANSWTTLPVRAVRAVGGFRAEDWVAHEATRSVGRVEEAVFRVEVSARRLNVVFLAVVLTCMRTGVCRCSFRDTMTGGALWEK